MLGILVSALLIVLASVVIGRARMLLAGWRRPEWVAGAVGLAVLVVLAAVPRPPSRSRPDRGDPPRPPSPSRARSSRRRSQRGGGGMRPPHPKPSTPSRSSSWCFDRWPSRACRSSSTSAPACSARASTRTTRRRSFYWADWLADGFGPQPKAVQFGYPVGPQALAAAVVGGHRDRPGGCLQRAPGRDPGAHGPRGLERADRVAALATGGRGGADRLAVPGRVVPGPVRVQGDGDGPVRHRAAGAPATRPPLQRSRTVRIAHPGRWWSRRRRPSSRCSPCSWPPRCSRSRSRAPPG